MGNEVHVGPTGPALVLRALRRHGDRPAFVSRDKVLTYRAVEDFIGRAQVALAALGVRPGEFVALLARNGAEAWMIGVAAQALGARLMNLHPMGSLADHVRCLEAVAARHVFVDCTTYLERGRELAAGVADIKVHALGRADFGPDLLTRIEAVGAAGPKDVSDPLEICAAHFTGGTTGAPKLIMARHHRAAAGVAAFSATYELPERPSVLAAGPITHVTGSLLTPTLIRGGVFHLLSGFDEDEVVATIARARINTAMLVPTMIYRLLDAPALAGADLSSLGLVAYSASPMSPARLVEAIDRMGPVFAQLYAQSECGPIAYMPKADHDPAHPERFAACGFPTPECAVRLVDGDDQPVAPGEAGEICVRAPYAFEGYHGNPEETARTLRDGWLHTGDIARADEAGRLYIVDRAKDMIVTGGFNVYPREVEDIVSAMPQVAACAVIGEPDDRWGEAVCAYVVLRPGARLDEDAVKLAVRTAKGPVHAPKTVRIVGSLAYTPAGKVDKKLLRDQAWGGSARRVN
jgi:fatty-acyl-CoA synthase